LWSHWEFDFVQRRSVTPLLDDYSDDSSLRKDEDGWHYGVEWDALQPRRTRIIKPLLFVSAGADSELDIQVKIYADSFPEPLILKIRLELTVQPTPIPLDQLLPGLAKIRTDANKTK
jgi:hypothetical protein